MEVNANGDISLDHQDRRILGVRKRRMTAEAALGAILDSGQILSGKITETEVMLECHDGDPDYVNDLLDMQRHRRGLLFEALGVVAPVLTESLVPPPRDPAPEK